MSKEVINKSLTKKKVDKFDEGSWKDNEKGDQSGKTPTSTDSRKGDQLGGTIASTVGGVANVATNAIGLAQVVPSKIGDVLSSQRDQLRALKSQNTTASTRSELNALASNMNYGDIENFGEILSSEDAGGPSGADWATGIIGGAAAGAAAGSAIAPPWGTIAGVVAGAGAAAAGLGVRASNAKRELENFKLEQEINKSNLEQSNNEIREAMENQNNQISQRELTNFRINNINAYGGPLFELSGDFDNGVIFIDEGGTHEENPMEGVMVGVDYEGTPNLVEEGEVIFNDYVFSNRLKPTKKTLEDGGFKHKYKDWTFAKIAEDLQRESSERPNDNISLNTLNDSMNRLITMQEQIRNKRGLKGENKLLSRGGHIFSGKKNITTEDILSAFQEVLDLSDKQKKSILKTAKKNNKSDWSTLGRYTPVVTNAISGLVNAVQTPDNMDYSHIDNTMDYYKNIPTITYNPIGGKQTYQPIDDSYLTNQILADAAANRRVVGEVATTGAQRAMLLSNLSSKVPVTIAQAKQQIADANQARKMQVAQFNLGIDQANRQGSIQAQMANQARAAQIAGAMGNAAQQKIAIDQYNRGLDQLKGQAVSGSIGALSEDLAGIATEKYWRNQIENNPAFMEYIANMNKAKASAKNGGMLTRKRRK